MPRESPQLWKALYQLKGPHHCTTIYGMWPHPIIFAAIFSKLLTIVNTEAFSAAIIDIKNPKKSNVLATAQEHKIKKVVLQN